VASFFSPGAPTISTSNYVSQPKLDIRRHNSTRECPDLQSIVSVHEGLIAEAMQCRTRRSRRLVDLVDIRMDREKLPARNQARV
jgi:hypothetical protein